MPIPGGEHEQYSGSSRVICAVFGCSYGGAEEHRLPHSYGG